MKRLSENWSYTFFGDPTTLYTFCEDNNIDNECEHWIPVGFGFFVQRDSWWGL